MTSIETARQESTKRDELIAAAEAMVPRIRARAAEAEERRRLPAETVRDIVDAGFLRMASPDRYGGCGLDCDAIFEIEAALGRGCGSTAWCYGVWAIHNWATGLFPERAQEEYYANPDVISSSSYYPTNEIGRAS